MSHLRRPALFIRAFVLLRETFPKTALVEEAVSEILRVTQAERFVLESKRGVYEINEFVCRVASNVAELIGD